MASEAAQAVAHEVLRQVEKGGKAFITTIAPKKGYAFETARSGKIQKTKAYQAVIRPVVKKMIIQREKALARMDKTVGTAKYRDATEAVAKLTKDIQLLSGGATENVVIGVKKLSDDELQYLAARS